MYKKNGVSFQTTSDGKQGVISGLDWYFQLTYVFFSTDDSKTDYKAAEITHVKRAFQNLNKEIGH